MRDHLLLEWKDYNSQEIKCYQVTKFEAIGIFSKTLWEYYKNLLFKKILNSMIYSLNWVLLIYFIKELECRYIDYCTKILFLISAVIRCTLPRQYLHFSFLTYRLGTIFQRWLSTYTVTSWPLKVLFALKLWPNICQLWDLIANIFFFYTFIS